MKNHSPQQKFHIPDAIHELYTLQMYGTPPELGYGQEIGERYLIHGEIDRGGSAIVYRAEDFETGLPVAVKTPAIDNQASLERFKREASVTALIGDLSSGSVSLVGAGIEDDGDLQYGYMAIERMEGGSLYDRLSHHRSSGLPLSALKKILAPTFQAAATAHELGIIHRDIKPRNILLDEAGNGKLADYGLAKTPEDADEESLKLTVDSPELITCNVTHQHDYVGTLHYVPGEILSEDEAHSTASDVYAAGVVMYEAATGLHPITRNQKLDDRTYVEWVTTCTPSMRDLGKKAAAGYVNLTSACMERRSENRPSMEQVAHELALL